LARRSADATGACDRGAEGKNEAVPGAVFIFFLKKKKKTAGGIREACRELHAAGASEKKNTRPKIKKKTTARRNP
jgi:hypothetical protein